MERGSCLIAIVGGSASGKTWLANELKEKLGTLACRISLDDFYRDRSHLSPAQRARVNYDHPRAIDWISFDLALRACQQGNTITLPQYDFTSHTRKMRTKKMRCKPIVLVEGLWLLRRARIRSLFDWSVFIECPESIRLERKLQRDAVERGRNQRLIREQFSRAVAPMHRRFVSPQIKWADLVIRKPIDSPRINLLVERIRRLQLKNTR